MSIPDDVISPQSREPEKSSSTCLILGLVFGGIGGFVLLCGGCCIGFAWFGFSEIERQVRQDLADNPVVQEHIGEISTFEMQIMDSIQQMSEQPDTFVFQIAGDKGSGRVTAVCRNDGSGLYKVVSGQLVLENGDTYELVEEADLPEASDMPIDGSAEAAATEEAFAARMREAIAQNPVLVEHLGEIESFTYDVEGSAAEPGDDVFVFQVTGSKAGGRLRAECIPVEPDQEEIRAAELILDSGEKFQLFPENPLP